MKLTIDRRIWLRGEGAGVSRLLRPSDGKQCCVGIYLSALGVRAERLSDIGAARGEWLPSEANWLCYTTLGSFDGVGLYDANDATSKGAEDERESKIAAIFAKHGVKVEFTN